MHIQANRTQTSSLDKRVVASRVGLSEDPVLTVQGPRLLVGCVRRSGKNFIVPCLCKEELPNVNHAAGMRDEGAEKAVSSWLRQNKQKIVTRSRSGTSSCEAWCEDAQYVPDRSRGRWW
jgi:hypothetical protein